MKPVPYTELSRIIDAEIVKRGHSETCTSISIDSRTCQPGDLFWAVKGENFDGNRFAVEAAEKGVSGIIVSRNIEQSLPDECWCLKVSDTLSALQRLAAEYRRQFDIPVIGITGTVTYSYGISSSIICWVTSNARCP